MGYTRKCLKFKPSGIDKMLIDVSKFKDQIKNYQGKPRIFDQTKKLREAAVVLAIGEETQNIPFIVRPTHMRSHAGQVALPGGSVDSGESAIDALRREFHEELGVDDRSLEVIGELDTFQSISDFYVHPFVASWKESEFNASPEEVSRVLSIPLDFFLNLENCRKERWVRKGLERDMFLWQYQGDLIWGLTSRILANFLSVLFARDVSEMIPLSPSRQIELVGE